MAPAASPSTPPRPDQRRRRLCLAIALAAATFGGALAPTEAARAEERALVFAAASLKTALDAIAADFQAAGGGAVVLSYAGSAALARQIQAGAPADLFLSANTAWMDAVDAAGALRPGARVALLGNRLALIAPADPSTPPPAREASPTLAAPLDLADHLGDGRLAMAFVDAVPAGIYGKAALETLGAWDAVAQRVAQTDSVRSALALVARGEAPLGVVYATDAAAEPRVRLLGLFPEKSHPAIIYPAALIRDAGPVAERFFAWLQGPAARARFEAQDFLWRDGAAGVAKTAGSAG